MAEDDTAFLFFPIALLVDINHVIITTIRIIFVYRTFSKAPSWFTRTAKQKENSKQAGHKIKQKGKHSRDEKNFKRQNF